MLKHTIGIPNAPFNFVAIKQILALFVLENNKFKVSIPT